jgi:NAD+ synthase
MTKETVLTPDVLKLDPKAATLEVEEAIRDIVFGKLKRRGVVIGLSGGVDSSTCAALCARALGSDRVMGLFLPEEEGASDSLRLGQLLARTLGIETREENITPILTAAGCYRRRDEAVREVIPEYDASYKCKIVLSNMVSGAAYALFTVVVQAPDGTITRRRLTAGAYRGILAATNFKQRTRKMIEYYYADRLHSAVVGTPNRLEYDQGFFVKNGDGAADLKPIAHLFKSQVYQLAEYLGVPEEIRRRPPSTDTYSLEQTQEEFYFSLPYETMDLCVWAKDHGMAPATLAFAGLTEEEAIRAYRMIETKRKAADYLHMPALGLKDVGPYTSSLMEEF